MTPLPSLTLSAGGGGPSNATSSAGIQTSTNTPFNFDGSGWVVNFGDGSTIRAEGNSGANQASQSPAGAGGAGLLAGMDPMMIGAAVMVLLLMRR